MQISVIGCTSTARMVVGLDVDLAKASALAAVARFFEPKLPADPQRLHFTYLDPDHSAGGGRLHDSATRALTLSRPSNSPVVGPLTDLLNVTFGPLPALSELLEGFEGVSEAYIYGSWRRGTPASTGWRRTTSTSL